MVQKVATLGMEGFLEDINLKIDYLMCCYFYSKFKQSTLYRDKIVSLSKTLQMHGHDAIEAKMAMQADLQDYLSKFFTTAFAEVTNLTAEDDPGINLQINAIVSEQGTIEGNSVSVGYSVFSKDSMLKQLINRSNGTTIYSA